MRNQKFYVCKVCDSVVGKLDDENKAFTCCDNKMEEMIPIINNKQIKYCFNNNVLEVSVSDKFSFVYVETSLGGQRKNVNKSCSSKVSFSFVEDKPFAIFAYSKVHGLIKEEL